MVGGATEVEVMDAMIVIVVSFAFGAATAWICLESRMYEINKEIDFIHRRKESLRSYWAEVEKYIQSLREVQGENGAVVGGYFDRNEMEFYKEKIKEIEILLEDEWKVR